MPIVQIKNLSFSYERHQVLEDINLEVEERDFLAIIGPNGGGKSTLLKLILGIESIQKGSIETFGEKPKKNLSKIGYVPQDTNINTDFPIKVIEVVLMGHIGTKQPLFGYAKEETMCAMGALAQVGMEEFAQQKIGSLSGGQRQRVMIARALCAHPQILILDEPTSNIDVDGQQQIYELLRLLNNNITIIVVSHAISVVLGFASKVVHINKKMTSHSLNKTANTIENSKHFCEVEFFNSLKEAT
ncbi:MAG: ABC transporter ATP-binding protein [Sulfurovaceae bacterium]|nr:ABC transporter ATP-binding protein [Sulfurovaceae bacterium]